MMGLLLFFIVVFIVFVILFSIKKTNKKKNRTVTLLTLLMHKNLSSIFLDFLTASNLSGFLHFFYFLEAIEV